MLILWLFVNGLFYFIHFYIIEFVEVTLVGKTILVSSVQLNRKIICTLPGAPIAPNTASFHSCAPHLPTSIDPTPFLPGYPPLIVCVMYICFLVNPFTGWFWNSVMFSIGQKFSALLDYLNRWNAVLFSFLKVTISPLENTDFLNVLYFTSVWI